VQRSSDQGDSATCDTCCIEKIFHQARHMFHLACNYAARSVEMIGTLKELRGQRDRVKGIAQLMSEHCQEFILGPIGGLRQLARGVSRLTRTLSSFSRGLF